MYGQSINSVYYTFPFHRRVYRHIHTALRTWPAKERNESTHSSIFTLLRLSIHFTRGYWASNYGWKYDIQEQGRKPWKKDETSERYVTRPSRSSMRKDNKLHKKIVVSRANGISKCKATNQGPGSGTIYDLLDSDDMISHDFTSSDTNCNT